MLSDMLEACLRVHPCWTMVREMESLQKSFAGGAHVVAFEPAPAMFAEAQENLKGFGGIVLCRSMENLKSHSFDFVFCLEVFEHLPQEQTDIALLEIERLLKHGGFAVIGVPHELFIPAAIKDAFRMTRRFGAFDAHPWNVFLAVLGRPPKRKLGQLEGLLPIHSDHLGFDYRRLEALLAQRFQIRRKRFNPIPNVVVPSQFGSLFRHRKEESDSISFLFPTELESRIMAMQNVGKIDARRHCMKTNDDQPACHINVVAMLPWSVSSSQSHNNPRILPENRDFLPQRRHETMTGATSPPGR